MHNFMALRMTNTTGVIYAAVGSGLVDDALFSAATHVRDDRRFTRDCSRCMLHDSRAGATWETCTMYLGKQAALGVARGRRRRDVFFYPS